MYFMGNMNHSILENILKYETDNMKPEVWLLYPMTEECKELTNIEYISDDGVSVHVFFVDIINITQSLNNLKKMLWPPNK